MLYADMGTELFPWQKDVLGAWLARGEDGRQAFDTCELSAPRQNGKNEALEPYELYQMVVCGAHILHTAHRVKTSKKSFRRLVRLFTDKRHGEIASMVSKITYTNGEEAIYLKNGASIEYSARSRAGNRGFEDIQCVVFDEAQDLTDDQLSATMYTLSASSTGERQMLFLGTPPDDASPGTVFARDRARALSGNPPVKTCWHEWSVEECPPKSATFEDIIDDIYRANPSMGYVLDLDFTRTEFDKANIRDFARERLGWWEPSGVSSAVTDAAAWDACGVNLGDVPKRGKKAFAVKFSPDGVRWALGACRIPEDGNPHVELVSMGDVADGIGQAARFLCDENLAETTAAVAVDGRAGAGALLDELGDAYPRKALMAPGTSGIVDACTMLDQAIRERRVSHWASEGQAALDESARTSIKRPVGNGGGWAYGGDNPLPMEACALALWAARNTKRNPEEAGVIT